MLPKHVFGEERAMTILELIEHDHQRLWSYLQQFDAVSSGRRDEAVARLATYVRDYFVSDHELLYAALERAADAPAAVAAARAEIGQLPALVDGLSDLALAPERLGEMRRLLTRHAVRERDELVAWTRQHLDETALSDLFDRARQRRTHQSPNDSLIFPADRFGIE
jgi:hypothetical protein